MRVAVYAIAKNEEAHVERWEACSQDADYRVILDTGSTDQTTHLAGKLGVRCERQVFEPFRFCDARNAALALVPDTIDLCVNLDLDEVLQPGWYDALQALPADTTRPSYKYIWSRNLDGSEGMVYTGHCIHRRTGYEWRYPVHELLTPLGEEQRAWCNLIIEHQPDAAKPRSQYLPMLCQFALDDPNSDRAAFYYARELFFHNQMSEASREFQRHLALPSAAWMPERAASMRYIAKCDPTNAEVWLLRAIAEAPAYREGWVDLAQHYYHQADWAGCFYASTKALERTTKPLEYFCEAYAWNETPYDLAALSAYNLGRYADALHYGQEALSIRPDDQRLSDNLAWYRKATGTIPNTHD
jgi:tetratricopeptide (TPR) repeat protein